jgi:hypothetical protein
MDDKLLAAIIGAAIAIISSWIKAWTDRKTAISNDLLKQRIQSLNSIWNCFIEAKNIYSHKISMGHPQWLIKYKSHAEEKINAFRAEVDKHQIVLPSEIIETLRDIDLYMYGLLNLEDQKPSEYQRKIEYYLKQLTTKTNYELGKRTHSISLKFRT